MTEQGVKPNDIMLSISDLAISRTHCRIIYEDGFPGQKRAVPKSFREFLKVFHDKSNGIYLPRELRMLIYKYI